MKMVNETLEVISYTYLKPVSCDKIDSVICSNFVYTLYTQNDDLVKVVSLERFNLATKELTVFDEITNQGTIRVNSESFNVNSKIKMFGLDFYGSYFKNDYVVDYKI